MTFPRAKLLPRWHCVFLGIGQMLLGKTPPFPGTLKQFLGISIAPGPVLFWYVLGSSAKSDFESSTGLTWTDLTWTDPQYNTSPCPQLIPCLAVISLDFA